jgi:hypothetical protein
MDGLSTLVHSACSVLASGFAGSRAISDRMATIAPVSVAGNCG